MIPRCLLICLFLLAPSLPRVASTDVFRFGRDIVLPHEQPFHNATCLLCSAFVDGRGSGSVRVFAGNVILDGAVAGKILVLGGNVTLTANAQAGDRIIIIGGRLHGDATAQLPAHTVLPPIIFLPLILLVVAATGGLIVLTRRMVRGPIMYPPLPRL